MLFKNFLMQRQNDASLPSENIKEVSEKHLSNLSNLSNNLNDSQVGEVETNIASQLKESGRAKRILPNLKEHLESLKMGIDKLNDIESGKSVVLKIETETRGTTQVTFKTNKILKHEPQTAFEIQQDLIKGIKNQRKRYKEDRRDVATSKGIVELSRRNWNKVKTSYIRNHSQEKGKYRPLVLLKCTCIDKDLYNKFRLTREQYYKYRDRVEYSQTYRGILKPWMSYEEMTKQLPCECFKYTAVNLSNLPITHFDKYARYVNCPRVLFVCANRVLGQHNSPDPQLCREVYRFYKRRFAPEIEEWLTNNFKIKRLEWLLKLKSNKKQNEILTMFYHYDDFAVQAHFYNPLYAAFVKGETQSKGDKPRQIGQPSPSSKYVGMLANEAIEQMMMAIYGDNCGFNRNYDDRARIFNKYKEGYKYITLDVSGMDQSHNLLMKMPWVDMINTICRVCRSEIEKYTSLDLFKNEMCKDISVISYDTQICKRQEHLWTLYLKDKMVSGSAYTSILNTFLMINYCQYVGEVLNTEIMSHAAGDDVCAAIPNTFSDDDITRAFYTVFSWPNNKQPHGNGLYLKYCVISDSIMDIKPCSTEAFLCPKCGVRIVRPFYKLLNNYYISQKGKVLISAGMDPADFRKLIYTGDMAWAHGLSAAELMLSTIGELSNKSLSSIMAEINKLTISDEKFLVRGDHLKNKFDIDETAEDEDDICSMLQCQKIVYELYNGMRIHEGGCLRCMREYENMLKYKYNVGIATIAYYRKALFEGREALASQINKEIQETYQRYDDEMSKPPSEKILDEICPKWREEGEPYVIENVIDEMPEFRDPFQPKINKNLRHMMKRYANLLKVSQWDITDVSPELVKKCQTMSDMEKVKIRSMKLMEEYNPGTSYRSVDIALTLEKISLENSATHLSFK